MKKKRLWLIILIVVLELVCVCLVACGVWRYYKQNKAEEYYHDLRKAATINTEETNKTETNETGENESVMNTRKAMDFTVLWEKNEDIYAWIEIPGMQIDYPVLQHSSDDTYYLNHTAEGAAGLPAAIYSESLNEKNFSEFIHILYGHNMKNGTMFSELHRYEEEGFLEENSNVYIYTPEHIYVYEIFAAIVRDDSHIMYAYDFSTEEGKQTYLDEVFSNGDERDQYLEDVEVTTQDQLLVLSTCVGSEGDKRYVVNAVLREVK